MLIDNRTAHRFLFEVFCLRLDWSFAVGFFWSGMIATLLLVDIALALSMRHPPFMVPAGWEWPPFQDFGERLTHAIALSTWQIVLAPIGLLISFTWAMLTRELLPRLLARSKRGSGTS